MFARPLFWQATYMWASITSYQYRDISIARVGIIPIESHILWLYQQATVQVAILWVSYKSFLLPVTALNSHYYYVTIIMEVWLYCIWIEASKVASLQDVVGLAIYKRNILPLILKNLYWL